MTTACVCVCVDREDSLYRIAAVNLVTCGQCRELKVLFLNIVQTGGRVFVDLFQRAIV